MKAHWKIYRLLLAVVAVGVLAAIVANPALARTSGVSQQMKVKVHKKLHRLARGAAAVGVSETAAASSVLAAVVTPAAKGGGGGEKNSAGACPASTSGVLPASNVDARYSSVGQVTTYTFESLTNPPQTSTGVPGLIKYCVYPETEEAPKSVTVSSEAVGANEEAWIARFSKKSPNFSFGRPSGNGSNIPLDEQTIEMGEAEWTGEAPVNQRILLHINDAEECHAIYGVETPETCFVLPKPGPVCNAGDETLAYNSIPTDFPHCYPPPALGFEAQSASEFGDMVTLAKGGQIKEMIVDFQSYGCNKSGHWNTGKTNPCVTEGEPATFTVPGGITASIYTVDELTDEIDYPAATTATINPNIPFRPSANAAKCTEAPGTDVNGGEDIGKWFDSVSGYCVNSIADLLHFTGFSALTEQISVGQKVVWTVQFNTSNSGYNPIGNNTECREEKSTPGCGYDSLNVGDYTYPGSTYSGTDVAASAWWAQGTLQNNLEELNQVCPECEPPLGPAALRPLGKIITE